MMDLKTQLLFEWLDNENTRLQSQEKVREEAHKATLVELYEAQKKIKKLRAAVELAEKAHELCIDELFEGQEENKKLRAALSEIIKQAWTNEPHRARLSWIYEIANRVLDGENDG